MTQGAAPWAAFLAPVPHHPGFLPTEPVYLAVKVYFHFYPVSLPVITHLMKACTSSQPQHLHLSTFSPHSSVLPT